MVRMNRWCGLAGLLVLLTIPGTVRALITKLTPLGILLNDCSAILTATVETVDADRPAMMLSVEKALKGKAGFTKMPVLLKGDALAQRKKDSEQLLKRVAPKLPMVLFVQQRDKHYLVFGYTNGTWFGMTGTLVDGEVRWSFSHCEPFLRRTFKGTTAEMTETVSEVLAGKRKAPPVDEEEKPGLGPEVKKEGAALFPPSPLRGRREEEAQLPEISIIPAVVIGGPLALLAMLFPTVFGGWKRWAVLISVACTMSTIYLLTWLFADRIVGTWWSSPRLLWQGTTLVALAGVVWAFERHFLRVRAGQAPDRPSTVEIGLLFLVVLIGAGWLLRVRMLGGPILDPSTMPIVLFTAAFCAGGIYAVWTRIRGVRPVPALSSEAVILTGFLAASATVGLPTSNTAGGSLVQEESRPAPELVWRYRLPARGTIDSTLLPVSGRLYVGAGYDDSFEPRGAVFRLDHDTGKPIWEFTDGKKVKPVFSSPVLVGDRLYVGEGYHQNYGCKVFCLNADSGEKVWEFGTGSHVESTPTVIDGKLFIGGGDDGMYCLSADKGEELWHFPGFHIDAPPTVAGARVYAGCGVGDEQKTTALLALDRDNGKLVWRVDVPAPVWSKPTVVGDRVYYTAGNGRLGEPEKNPIGIVGCVRAEDGKEVWTQRLRRSILGSPTLTEKHIYVGTADGFVYCLERETGEIEWVRPIGKDAATLATSADETAIYAVCGDRTVALGPTSGAVLWQIDLRATVQAPADTKLTVFAAPVVEVFRNAEGVERRRVYVAVRLTGAEGSNVGELCCFEEPTR
jgi:outer membrane protein assembly factor BamB